MRRKARLAFRRRTVWLWFSNATCGLRQRRLERRSILREGRPAPRREGEPARPGGPGEIRSPADHRVRWRSTRPSGGTTAGTNASNATSRSPSGNTLILWQEKPDFGGTGNRRTQKYREGGPTFHLRLSDQVTQLVVDERFAQRDVAATCSAWKSVLRSACRASPVPLTERPMVSVSIVKHGGRRKYIDQRSQRRVGQRSQKFDL